MHPNFSTILEGVATTINFLAALAMIFSLKRAPPPPLIKSKLESTSSAPSIANQSSQSP